MDRGTWALIGFLGAAAFFVALLWWTFPRKRPATREEIDRGEAMTEEEWDRRYWG
jgi:hypothetical protein